MAAIVHTRMSKLYEGPRSISGSFGASPAQSAVNAFLTQPSCVLSADVNGLVENYAPAATMIVVEVAGRVDTGNWTISTAKSESVGTVTVSGASVSVASMEDDAGWVDITASKVGYESVTRRFTLAKVRQKGGVRTVTALPLNPAAVNGELAIFLDTADQAVRGLYGWSGSAWVRTSDLPNGSVTADKLAAGAIEATKFANGIEPVSIVSLLPAVTGYSGTKLVYLTTDNKIYRYTGTAWEKGTPTTDLVGTVSADQLAANSVTAGKIAAGAVATDQLKANAVTASKLTLTDTSNIYPDYDILDPNFYSGSSFLRVASSISAWGAYFIYLTASTVEKKVSSQWFQIESSADYFVEVSVATLSADAASAVAAYIELASYSGGATTPVLTRSLLISRRQNSSSFAREDISITTASNERRARIVFVREAGGTMPGYFGGPVVRRRNNAKLIVDGSVVADKLATNAVEARHILAGAVTAEKMSVNKLSAISADLGDATAGTFTLSSTGFIKGGATSYTEGTGFWLGYDGGKYKFRAGAPNSSGFEWNGDGFYVYGPDGSVTISSGVVDWAKINGTGKPEDGATVGADWNENVSNKPDPTSFLETFESGSVAQWTNHSGTGELSVVSVADSLTGGKVLRIGNNSGNDQAWLIHKQNIPFDPSALYRIKFRVRRTAGTGVVYLGLAGVAADGVTWVNTPGANDIGSQHYVAASNVGPSSTWTEYVGYVKGTAATGQVGTNPPITAPLKLHQNVKYIRPLILANHDSVAGMMEVDYCSIELMTDAMSWDGVSGSGKDALVTTASTALTNADAAQTAANTANNTLADIASDSKLTPAEKKITKKEWDGIVAEKAGINAQATALGITTENANYNYVYNELNNYITPLLSSLTTPSDIDGPTFRSMFSWFYANRQALLNKISAVAATKADWASVTGSDKPENGATVGANWNTNLTGKPSNAQLLNNLLDPSTWTRGTYGSVPGFNINGEYHENYREEMILPDGSTGIAWGCYPGNSSTVGDGDGGWDTDSVPVDHTKTYRFSVWVMRTGETTGYTYLGCNTNSNGVINLPGGSHNINPYFWTGNLPVYGRWYLIVGYVRPSSIGTTGSQENRGGLWDSTTGAKISSGTDFAWAADTTIAGHRCYLYYSAPDARQFMCWPRMELCDGNEPSIQQLLAMGSVSAANPITPSNVTTYIANAALGNAQIGGNLWSTNWNYAGGTGWLLDRSGNFYGNNIYARGDIEASSLKVNTAMVQTLNIAGNAVVVPTYVEYPSAAAYNVYQSGTETEWTLLSDVVTVNVDCSALIFIGCNDPVTSTVHTLSVGAGGRGHYNFPAGTEWASVRVYRNGALVKRLAQWNVSSTKKGTGKHIGTYQESERDCVFIDTLIAEIPLVAGTNTIDIRCWVKMADGDGGARRNSNAYMLIMGAQR